MKVLPVSLTHTEKVLGWSYWGLQLLVIPAVISLLVPIFAPGLGIVEQNFLYMAFNFVAMTAIMMGFLRKSWVVFLQRPFHTLRWAGVAYILYWVSFLVLAFLINNFVPAFQNVNDGTIALYLKENPALTSIGVILLAPVAEELIYRGVIFGSIYDRSPFAAYVLSCAVFSAVHVMGYIGQWDILTLAICFLQYIPAGFCLAWAYARTGTILAPILIHIAVNQTGILSWR
jgi:membrane protease YdiL (CAAX protease family)